MTDTIAMACFPTPIIETQMRERGFEPSSEGADLDGDVWKIHTRLDGMWMLTLWVKDKPVACVVAGGPKWRAGRML